MINGAQLRGVITDWGGVLTTPILTTVQAWIQADSIDWDSYRTVMRAWVFDAYGPDASQNRSTRWNAASARAPSSSRCSRPGCSAPTAGS